MTRKGNTGNVNHLRRFIEWYILGKKCYSEILDKMATYKFQIVFETTNSQNYRRTIKVNEKR